MAARPSNIWAGHFFTATCMFVYRTVCPIAMLVSQKVPQKTVVTLIKEPSCPQQVWFLPHRSSGLNIKMDYSVLHVMCLCLMSFVYFLPVCTRCHGQAATYSNAEHVRTQTLSCHEQVLLHTAPILYRSISYHDHIIAAAPHKKTTNHFKSISPYPKILIFTSISDLIYL